MLIICGYGIKLKRKDGITMYENFDVNRLPAQYRPLSAWSYFGYTVLFSIPLVGFIALIVCSFSQKNYNRRSFARSYFCWTIIVLALSVILAVTGALTGLLSEVAGPLSSM